MKKKDISKTLRAARDLLNHGGKHWIKGNLTRKKDGEKAYCALGGIQAALGVKNTHKLTKETRPVALALAQQIRKERGMRLIKDDGQRYYDGEIIDTIVNFNDSPETSWERLKKVFTAAAKEPVT